jgi:hypothetical protein
MAALSACLLVKSGLLYPEKSAYFSTVAVSCIATANVDSSGTLPRLSEETAAPLFACSVLHTFYYMAVAPDLMSLLQLKDADPDHSQHRWLNAVRRSHAIYMRYPQAVREFGLRHVGSTTQVEDPSSINAEEFLRQVTFSKRPLGPVRLESELQKHFHHDSNLDLYITALHELMVCWWMSDRGWFVKPRDIITLRAAVLRFWCVVPEEFLGLVHAIQQPALILLTL